MVVVNDFNNNEAGQTQPAMVPTFVILERNSPFVAVLIDPMYRFLYVAWTMSSI